MVSMLKQANKSFLAKIILLFSIGTLIVLHGFCGDFLTNIFETYLNT